MKMTQSIAYYAMHRKQKIFQSRKVCERIMHDPMLDKSHFRIQFEFQSLNLLARTDSESAKKNLVARVLYSLLLASENPLI